MFKRTCQCCGKEFFTKSLNAKFCSNKCRLRAHRARRALDPVAARKKPTSRASQTAAVVKAITTALHQSLPAGQTPSDYLVIELTKIAMGDHK